VRTPVPWPLPSRPVTTQELRDAGVSARRIEGAARDGRLIRIRHGVYLGVAAWPEDRGEQHLLRAWAEQLAKPAAVVSHQSAARYWQLALPREDWTSEPVHLTVPAGTTQRSETGPRVVQHVAALPADHVTKVPGGYRVTSLPRTAVDLAAGLPLPEALVVLDAALRLQCSALVVRAGRRELGNPRLVAVAREPFCQAARHRRQNAGVAKALEVADPLRESPIESLSFGHLVEYGLPLPRCQAPIRTPVGMMFPDFLWEEAALIGESDGRVKYTDSAAVMREKEREQVLRDLGFRIVRWSGREIHLTPGAVLARIERALQA
jgi:hypothetical protein